MRKRPFISQTLLVCVICSAAASGQHGRSGDEPSEITLAGGKTILPMSLYGNKPVIEAKINGKGPFKFFLDTGAGGTVLSQELADELKLPTDGKQKVGDPANPQAIEANRNLIDKLELGDAAFTKLMALSFDRTGLYPAGGPRGVLGMPLFRKLLLTIDYPGSRVIVAKGALAPADGKSVLNFRMTEGGIFGLDVNVGGTPMMAHIDTGAPSGISFPEPMMNTLKLKAKPVEMGRGRTVGGESIVYGAKFDGQISLGDYKLDEPDVSFFGRLRSVNLGYSFLNPFAITIDQQNLRMKFERGTTTAAAIADAKPKIPAGRYAEFVGNYGERMVTIENETLYLQRVSGPMGDGPKLKLTEVKPGEFALDGQTEVRIKFQRGTGGAIEAVNVLNPAGAWETSKKQ